MKHKLKAYVHIYIILKRKKTDAVIATEKEKKRRIIDGMRGKSKKERKRKKLF